MIQTQAWVLHEGAENAGSALDSDGFRLERFAFAEPDDDEMLVEPLFGSWEGNMSHALARRPIDVCRRRGEARIVLGNSCVLRVLRPGPAAPGVREGDLGIYYGGQTLDAYGYTVTVHAYDAPGTVGALARRMKIPARCYSPLPTGPEVAPQRWAAFPVRYLTAWSNWKVAYGAYRLQVDACDDPSPYVLGWGGGSTFAELDLARRQGCRAAMVAGNDARLELLARHGITALDRRRFPALDRGEQAGDAAQAYRTSEEAFLDLVHAWSRGRGAAIVVDYLGGPVLRASLRALGREGVLTSAGWLLGAQLRTHRAVECIARHIHVHTHGIRLGDCPEAIAFAARTGWLPEVTEVYAWDEVDRLARDAASGAVQSYFPVYRVNDP